MGHDCVRRGMRDEESMHHQLKLSCINMAIRPHTDAWSINKNKRIKVHLWVKHVKLNMFMWECMVHAVKRVCIMYNTLFEAFENKWTVLWELQNFVCMQLTKEDWEHVYVHMCLCGVMSECVYVHMCMCVCKTMSERMCVFRIKSFTPGPRN